MGKAPSVPKSLLRVKIWYDNGFLQADKIKTHDKAKDYIYATLAHVQHFMCSSTLGTFLETEVCIMSKMSISIDTVANNCTYLVQGYALLISITDSVISLNSFYLIISIESTDSIQGTALQGDKSSISKMSF